VTRIVVIDPQPAVRAGLAMLLRTEPGMVPVGAAASAAEGLELVSRQRPDVVLLDHQLLPGDGLTLCRRMPPAVRVILYTADPEGELVLLARIAGADGLIDKSADPRDLFEAIRVVARGGSALPPLEPGDLDAAAHAIEPEDLALLAMLADGTPAADVADTLRLDRRTVGRRIERLMGRLRRLEGRTAVLS
jgi:DNA-binding NarL/FixJ family response regulator